MSLGLKPAAALAIALGASLLTAGCEREQRRFDPPPADGGRVDATQVGSIRAGPSPSTAASASVAASASGSASASASASASVSAVPAGASGSVAGEPPRGNPLEGNAYEVAQGKRLYRWFNCNGCHGSGGGGMGPPLMDDQWRYGHEASQIVATLMQGRPNGMPAFAGRITEQQAWQLAAYVRSMSGQLRADVAPSRSDSLSSGPPEARRERELPKPAAAP